MPDVFDRIAEEWSPPELTAEDVLDAEPSTSFAALLDQASPVMEAGDALPPLWHWFHFTEWPSQHELGEDGHLADGAFVPPLPDRRRVFGGGRLVVREPLRCGDTVRRRSKVSGVRVARGRSGRLLLVTVVYEFTVDGEIRLVEEQDIVYRRAADIGVARPDEPAADEVKQAPWNLGVLPDPVLLFRFSALTSNAHRIHYDRAYAAVEGHAGLVVHGPLLALLMLELPRRYAPRQRVERFSWRVRRTLFDGAPVIAEGAPNGVLRAANPGGPDAAEARFE